MESLIKNKRGQIEGIILAIVTLFIVGIIFFFANHMNKQIYDKFDDILSESEDYNDTLAQQTTEKFADLEGSRMWDYAFLAVFIGMFIQMLVLSFASRANVAFFWIYTLISIIILIIGTVLSNIWQSMAGSAEFAETVTRFTITNTILGTYYPTVITALIFLGLIILFGKFPGREE